MLPVHISHHARCHRRILVLWSALVLIHSPSSVSALPKLEPVPATALGLLSTILGSDSGRVGDDAENSGNFASPFPDQPSNEDAEDDISDQKYNPNSDPLSDDPPIFRSSAVYSDTSPLKTHLGVPTIGGTASHAIPATIANAPAIGTQAIHSSFQYRSHPVSRHSNEFNNRFVSSTTMYYSGFEDTVTTTDNLATSVFTSSSVSPAQSFVYASAKKVHFGPGPVIRPTQSNAINPVAYYPKLDANNESHGADTGTYPSQVHRLVIIGLVFAGMIGLGLLSLLMLKYKRLRKRVRNMRKESEKTEEPENRVEIWTEKSISKPWIASSSPPKPNGQPWVMMPSQLVRQSGLSRDPVRSPPSARLGTGVGVHGRVLKGVMEITPDFPRSRFSDYSSDSEKSYEHRSLSEETYHEGVRPVQIEDAARVVGGAVPLIAPGEFFSIGSTSSMGSPISSLRGSGRSDRPSVFDRRNSEVASWSVEPRTPPAAKLKERRA